MPLLRERHHDLSLNTSNINSEHSCTISTRWVATEQNSFNAKLCPEHISINCKPTPDPSSMIRHLSTRLPASATAIASNPMEAKWGNHEAGNVDQFHYQYQFEVSFWPKPLPQT